MAACSHSSQGPTCSSSRDINSQSYDDLTRERKILSLLSPHSQPSCSTDIRKRTFQLKAKRMTPAEWEDFEGIDQLSDESKRLYNSIIRWLIDWKLSLDHHDLNEDQIA